MIELFTENESIEIIVQFKTPMDSSRWNDIDEIGLEKLGEMKILHGGLFKGNENQIRSLSLMNDIRQSLGEQSPE